jgi:hypothetical protein
MRGDIILDAKFMLTMWTTSTFETAMNYVYVRAPRVLPSEKGRTIWTRVHLNLLCGGWVQFPMVQVPPGQSACLS